MAENTKPKRPPKKKEPPLTAAIKSWLTTLPPSLFDPLLSSQQPLHRDELRQSLLLTAPKRFVIYEPMALLPSGSFSSPSPWPLLFDLLSPAQKSSLWTAILAALSHPKGPPLTHLAINEGIPLHNSGPEAENTLRSPTGLHLLHGDFGSPTPSSPFETALWVTTKQNSLTQTWAPVHTMFSRGNIKEKARVLSFPPPPPPSSSSSSVPPSTKRQKERSPISQEYAIDLYAGIGYFVFSYAKLGFRLLCWEINPWSVEGLRRGALENKFSVRIIKDPAELAKNAHDLLFSDCDHEQIVVFQESNIHAARRLEELRSGEREIKVKHVNCGFLPTSEPIWRDALSLVQHGQSPEENEDEKRKRSCMLHLHENVHVKEIEGRREEINNMFGTWCSSSKGTKAKVEHVELVKTFAPDVWHCVFDLSIITRE
ncbi:putative tRNA wybutosine-synthesizing protein 2 [Podospora australis]|uniref:tRNA wybutosine-synthesizing protein 2 n=1 Tax=Podospora australis TaxID=1536484 RepID=A0AAN6WXN4_9PEZI|nr:putative tRNA wybutosine-synthesizing protein 2 [Podospora australis]